MSLTNGNVEIIDLLGGEKLDVAETDVAYTNTFICRRNVSYAFEYEVESDGTVDVKIEIEQGNTPPATEGEASDDMVVPEDAATFDDDLTDEDRHIKAYTPAVTRFLRAKVTGQGSNAASTKLVKFNVCTIVNL